MTISVCMGIYNGEKYIEEQLQSILNQTRQPEEVILCDDCSNDRTVDIVNRFLEKNGLQQRWKLCRNRENLGYPGNFYQAMELTNCDIVFLADQDDVWHERKLEEMCRVMEETPETAVLSCKYGLIDREGKRIQSLLSPTHCRGTGTLREVELREVFYKCQWPGMVLAYRNSWYRQQVLPGLPASRKELLRIPHDLLLCVTAAEEEGFRQLDAELASHRRHEQNTGKEEHRLSRLLQLERKRKEIETYLNILENLEACEILSTESGRELLRQKKASMQGRLRALESGRICSVLKNAWNYRTEVRAVTVICDVLIVRQRRKHEKTS